MENKCHVNLNKSCLDGIRSVQLYHDFSINNSNKDVTIFAQKCINIKHFEMHFTKSSNDIKQIKHLVMWVALKLRIQCNNVYVTLALSDGVGVNITQPFLQQVLKFINVNQLECNEINFRSIKPQIWIPLLNNLENLKIIESRLQALNLEFQLSNDQPVKEEWNTVTVALSRLPKLQIMNLNGNHHSHGFSNLLRLLQMMIDWKQLANSIDNTNTNKIMFILDFRNICVNGEGHKTNFKDHLSTFVTLLYTLIIKGQTAINIHLQLQTESNGASNLWKNCWENTLKQLFHKLKKDYISADYKFRSQLYDTYTLPYVQATFADQQDFNKKIHKAQINIATAALKQDELSHYKKSFWD